MIDRILCVAAVLALSGCAAMRHANAQWRIHISLDRMTDREVKYADIPAKARDAGIDSALEMTCSGQRRDFDIWLSKPMSRGRIGVSLRIDGGMVEPRFLNVFSDPSRIPILQAPPFDLVSRKRFRVTLFPTGGPVLFYDFDLSGITAAAKAIGC